MSDVYEPRESFALSASAGSGKTFALTTRLLGMLLSGVSPGEILAITFTNLAANEIRDGLFRRLDALEHGGPEETGIYAGLLKTDKHTLQEKAKKLRYELVEQFSFLRVSTIHSFLGRMLFSFPRETGYMLDLSIIDEREREKMLSESTEDFYRLLSRDTPLFDRILDFIRVYREGRAKTETTIREIYRKVSAKYFVLKDLIEETANSDGIVTGYHNQKKRIWSGRILQLVRVMVETCRSYMETHGENKNLRSFERKLSQFMKTRNPRVLCDLPAFKRTEEEGPIRYLKPFFNGPFLDGTEKKEASPFQKAFEAVKREVRRFVACEMDYYIDTWFEMFRRIHAFYSARKKNRKVVDFDDIELVALGLLETLTDYGYLDYRLDSSIRYVLIDEFQDTSESQWEVLKTVVNRALAEGGNFFYVGDVKQSIYRFRGGEPWLFEAVRKRYDLSERNLEYNYRQNGLLVDFVNSVFTGISERIFTDYGYKRQILSPKRRDRDEGFLSIARYEQKEAMLSAIVDTVHELEKEGVSLDDIAVLCRKNSEAQEVESLFISHRIPYKTSGRSLLLSDFAVLDVVNLLKLCVKPTEPLLCAGFLRSRMGGLRYEILETFDAVDLERLKRHDAALCETLVGIVEGSRYLPPSETIWRIYNELDTLGAYPDNREALLDLLEAARLFEDGLEIPTLERFLIWLEENKNDLPVKSGAGKGIVVQTIHKAKGLEYHSVILPYLSKQFKFRLDNSLLYTRDEGKKADAVGIAGSAYAAYLDMDRILSRNDTEYRVDELNALYVALTRARENLILMPLLVRGESVGDVVLSALDPGYDREDKSFNRTKGRIVPSREKTGRVERTYERHPLEPRPHMNGYVQEEPVATSVDVRKRRTGMLKGLLYHKVLELSKTLPSPEEIERLLDRAMVHVGFSYTGKERRAAKEVAKRSLLNTVADRRLARYFSEGAVSEIETFSSQYKNLIGRVDRAFIGDIISIIDFKTDAPDEGRTLDTLVRAYSGQVACYCRSFTHLYPEKSVEGWLYFSEAPEPERLVQVF